ncbi:MAG TPA: MarR family winged helix-turn-helix transcriptional regulator [Solirubrobacterales bacterium]|jgi:DNA-binding MarR family transcriptional regulator|nr:MarR family winged helix-turn-helix transcriptional regulator [Solirubrobacterales bacterium]
MTEPAAATTTALREGDAPAGTPHGEAWGALARTHAAVTQRLQEALAQGDYPPLPWYEVLATVADAADQRMRMGDLAEVLVITRGGLTKLVDRLVKAGLLERTFCETDRRVSYATLLPAGSTLLAEMRPVIVGELQIAFSANISEAQAELLREMLDRVRSTACGGIA